MPGLLKQFVTVSPGECRGRRCRYAGDCGAIQAKQHAMAADLIVTNHHLVLLDLMLPYVSGFQLLSEIRENPAWRHVPVLVVSAKVLESDVVRALDLGANDFITKPFRPQELLARIRRVIADREEQFGA